MSIEINKLQSMLYSPDIKNIDLAISIAKPMNLTIENINSIYWEGLAFHLFTFLWDGLSKSNILSLFRESIQVGVLNVGIKMYSGIFEKYILMRNSDDSKKVVLNVPFNTLSSQTLVSALELFCSMLSDNYPSLLNDRVDTQKNSN